MYAPRLRFNEFTDTWTQNTINEISVMFSGGTPKSTNRKFYSGEIPFIRSGEIHSERTELFINEEALKSSSAKMVQKGDILYALYGATSGEVGISKIEGAINQAILCIKPSCDVYFLKTFLESQKKSIINRFLQGGQGNLSASIIKEISIHIPSINEQVRISNFFKVLDKKIQLQQEKMDLLKEQKKGYMQKIFTQELCFKDDRGQEYPNWKKQIKAEQLFDPISNKNHNGESPVLSATQEHGMVYRDSLDRQMSFNDDNLGSYKLVEPKDFIISLRSFQGGIEYSNLQGLVSPAYTVFRKKNALVNELYFSKLFKTDNFIMRLNATTYGIRDGKAISYKDFSTLKFDVPCLEEQIKIANFLDTFDKKIAHETTKLTQLTYKKQYFMQQMFI